MELLPLLGDATSSLLNPLIQGIVTKGFIPPPGIEPG